MLVSIADFCNVLIDKKCSAKIFATTFRDDAETDSPTRIMAVIVALVYYTETLVRLTESKEELDRLKPRLMTLEVELETHKKADVKLKKQHRSEVKFSERSRVLTWCSNNTLWSAIHNIFVTVYPSDLRTP